MAEFEKHNRTKSPLALIPRSRREANDDSFSNIGLCLGDLFPIVRHKHPNQNVTIQLYTKRAPSMFFNHSPKLGATINILLSADIFVESKIKVGTLNAEATIKAEIKINNQHITGSSNITYFRLTNPDGDLNVPQETLDQFGDFGKSFIIKAMNEALEKGIKVKLPSNKELPFTIDALKFDIVDHAIYVAFDFAISPSIIAQLTGSKDAKNQCPQA